MSPHLFCCPNIKPTHLPKPEHEQTFNEFTKWAVTTINNKAEPAPPADASLCIQLVQQIPNGPLESIRYFVNDQGPDFEEISEDGIVNANFVKSHEYKSFQCSQHNQVFKLNLYERGNTGSHRWRANIAKPLRQLEHAFKHRASSGSGSTGSGSSLRSGLGSVGSGSGYRSSPVYGYGSGMGYGSGWGSSLGAGCGPNWGTGVSDDKNRASSTIVETGSNGDGDSDGDDSEVVSQSSDGENEGDEDGSEDLVVAFSPTSPAEVAKHSSEEQEVVTSSPPETQVTSEDNIVDQSYLEVENYGFYESGGSADDYGSYDCDGLDQDMTFDQNYRDCDDDAY